MFRKIHDTIDKIPSWAYNLLTLISFIIAIAPPISTAITQAIKLAQGKGSSIVWPLIGNVSWTAAIIILLLILIKDRTSAARRVKTVSGGMHQFTHRCRDTFFEILNEHEKNTLTADSLTTKVKSCLRDGLDALCDIVADFTGEEVSACIKLIECKNFENLDIDSATVRVLCRSSKSDSRRNGYDNGKERAVMYLKNDTALMRIVENVYGQQDYFYQGDLDKFAKSCKDVQEEYVCPTKKRSDFYNGTMVLPIRALFEKLYHFKRNDGYHIIGFLCVDSMSKKAFRPEQEIYNCNLANTFADEFYVILSMYRHYLNKIKQKCG